MREAGCVQNRYLLLILKHLGHCFIFVLPLDKELEATKQVKINNWLFFPPLGNYARLGPLNLMSWRLSVCLSYSAEVVYSELGTKGHRSPKGVDMHVCCWSLRGREVALWTAENAWWWVTKNRARGDNRTWDIPDITPTHQGGSGRGDLLVSMAPCPERRNGCLFCPLWRWRWTESRRLAKRGRH